MYQCSVCKKEVIVDHKNPPIFQCECEGRTVIAEMQAQANGYGGIKEVLNNNLEDSSAFVIKQMMTMVLGTEFFKENKKEIYARDVVIEDKETKRKFSFTVTAQEIWQDSQE